MLINKLYGDAESRRSRPLADPCLQHPQLAALDGELDVAEVAVVRLKPPHDLAKVVVRLRVELLEVLQGERVPDARNDVLALSVRQVVAVSALFSSRWVPREAHTRTRGRAEVPEHHGDDVDRSAQVVGDPLTPAIDPGAVGVPRVEDCVDGKV